MPITDYMSYGEVRAICGVSENETPDSVLGLDLYEERMILEALQVVVPDDIDSSGSDLLTAYASLPEEASRTTLQKKFALLTLLFLRYSVAAELINSASMSFPKTVSDGKAVLTRFSSEATFRDTINAILRNKAWLKASIEALPDTAVVSVAFRAVPPNIDVVTNE